MVLILSTISVIIISILISQVIIFLGKYFDIRGF